ncbi:hypothetical protein RIF29_19121 [Crotalaria pallida]|uniref:Uncharacterized protein n=1 Tax=Crotalaria pallida TaxID=3830 RepID=A0AAN9EYV7_CROPI
MVVVGPCSGGGFKPQGRGFHNIAVWRRRTILTNVAEARLQLRLSKLLSTMVVWGEADGGGDGNGGDHGGCLPFTNQLFMSNRLSSTPISYVSPLGKYCIYQIGEEKKMRVSNAFPPQGVL